MHINRIRIENFKSIYEPIELDFNNIKGFWKIAGSVGSGKTTIGEAIIYGLFGSVGGKNQADLISWGRKHGTIELWCTSKSNNIYIKRELNAYGQSPIYVEINGEELIFTNKRDAQSQLEQEYYDTSKTTLELLCIISFNNFKSLATLNSNDTKKFLDQVLGFSTLTEYTDICKRLRSDNLIRINQINSTIDKLDSQVRKLEELSNTAVITGDIVSVKQEINSLMVLKDQLEKEIKLEILGKKEQQQKLDKKKTTLITLGKNKKKEIDFIEKGVCPTCGAPIDQSQLESKKQERLLLLEQYEAINTQCNEICAELMSLDEKMTSINSEYKVKIDDAKILLTRLEEQAKRIQINASEIEIIKQNISGNEKLLRELQKEDAEWEQLYNILSVQIRSKILQSFIPSLNNNILKYTQRLHLPYIIQFDSNFKCNISHYGMDREISISSLSTGQLKTVDMVTILGVLGTIIGSNGINILFLDELFSNLDNNLRGEMCAVLKESVDPNNTVFIISHTELEDKYFDGELHMKLEVSEQYEKHSKIFVKNFVTEY
jgi:DNA repair exonuclease SbcCD ATPase subunit